MAVVTGGSRGIGRAIVERLHADDFDVVTCGRGERPHELDEHIGWVRADVARSGDCDRLIVEAAARGALTALVNNAGVQITKTLQDSTDDDWDQLVGINCRGVFTMSRAAMPHLERNGGTIVNVGSIAGNAAERSMALYNATKSFVHGFTRSIAVDHGPRVRCNAVSPGWIDTQLTEDGFALSRDPEAARRDAVMRHPLQRLGDPDDVAAVVSWLLSKDAAFLTGQCITVDGGLTAATPILPID